MWATAVPAPPPTPSTLMTALGASLSTSSNISRPPSGLLMCERLSCRPRLLPRRHPECGAPPSVCRTFRPARHGPRSAPTHAVLHAPPADSRSPATRPVSTRLVAPLPVVLLEIALEPPHHLVPRAAGAAHARARGVTRGLAAHAAQQEAHAAGVDLVRPHVHPPRHVQRHAQAHRHVEALLGEFAAAFHLRAAAGEHDAGTHQLLEPGAAQFGLHHFEQLL